MTAKQFTWTALAAWFIAIVVLGSEGAFVGLPGQPPLAIVLGAMLPLAAFAALYAASGKFRDLLLSADLGLLSGVQAWRVGGFGFLALYAHGLLPGLFAWPAGLGDIAVGVAAPWMALALARDRGFAASPRFVLWNWLGILDLAVALSLGGLSSGVVPGLTGSVTSAAMSQMPLVLIPAYLVPLFIMLHIAALLQARRASAVRRSARQGDAAGTGAPAPAW